MGVSESGDGSAEMEKCPQHALRVKSFIGDDKEWLKPPSFNRKITHNGLCFYVPNNLGLWYVWWSHYDK